MDVIHRDNSERLRRIKQCRSKIRYKRADEAHEARKDMRARGIIVEVYRCPWCDGWHVGGKKSSK